MTGRSLLPMPASTTASAPVLDAGVATTGAVVETALAEALPAPKSAHFGSPETMSGERSIQKVGLWYGKIFANSVD